MKWIINNYWLYDPYLVIQQLCSFCLKSKRPDRSKKHLSNSRMDFWNPKRMRVLIRWWRVSLDKGVSLNSVSHGDKNVRWTEDLSRYFGEIIKTIFSAKWMDMTVTAERLCADRTFECLEKRDSGHDRNWWTIPTDRQYHPIRPYRKFCIRYMQKRYVGDWCQHYFPSIWKTGVLDAWRIVKPSCPNAAEIL